MNVYSSKQDAAENHKKIRIGFIGTGNISGAHMNVLSARGDVEIVALCDINPEALRHRQDEFGGQGFAQYEEMLDSCNLDAVYICTPPDVREGPLTACAEKNIPAFCEKPVERSLDRAGEIERRLTELNGRAQIGYVFRSMPSVARIKEAIAEDKIHAVRSMYGCGVSLTMQLPAWFYDKDKSGGALIDQATHNLDLLRYLVGEVSEIRGLAGNPVKPKEPGYTIDETISLAFTFEDGTAGSHLHTWVGDEWRNEIDLLGEKGIYRINLNRGEATIIRGREQTTYSQDLGSIFRWETERFLKMVSTGDWSDNPCTYSDGLRTLALTLACDEAVST